MVIKTITTVGFDMPQEADLAHSFDRKNDMRDWVKSEDNKHVYYIRTKSVWADTYKKGVR